MNRNSFQTIFYLENSKKLKYLSIQINGGFQKAENEELCLNRRMVRGWALLINYIQVEFVKGLGLIDFFAEAEGETWT